MSISSIAPRTWTPPFQPQSGIGGASGAFPPPTPDASGGTQGSSGCTASGNLFQQLASGIQALLVQAQGTMQAASTTGTTAATPEQQVGAELQSLIAQLQSGQSGSSPGAQTATTGQTATQGRVQPHHHHHHHAGGAEPGADTAAGADGTTASSTVTAASTATPASSVSGSDQTVSRAFASDIVQALQAYGSSAQVPAASGLTA